VHRKAFCNATGISRVPRAVVDAQQYVGPCPLDWANGVLPGPMQAPLPTTPPGPQVPGPTAWAESSLCFCANAPLHPITGQVFGFSLLRVHRRPPNYVLGKCTRFEDRLPVLLPGFKSCPYHSWAEWSYQFFTSISLSFLFHQMEITSASMSHSYCKDDTRLHI
jgi:hypothetical protein